MMEPQWAARLDIGDYPNWHTPYAAPNAAPHSGPAVECEKCWKARLAEYTGKPVLASGLPAGREPAASRARREVPR